MPCASVSKSFCSWNSSSLKKNNNNKKIRKEKEKPDINSNQKYNTQQN
jgi:hypothetical protein